MSKQVMWTMKNGQQINVDDMTESHAKNSLKMLINRVNAWNKEIEATRPKWSPQGEIAQDDADRYELYMINPDLTCCCDEFHICQQCWERQEYLR